MTRLPDETHDVRKRSWVESANRRDSDFPIQNLPLGVFSPRDASPRGGVAIGDMVLDLRAALTEGWLEGDAAEAAEAASSRALNELLAMDIRFARALRRQLSGLLADDNPERGRLRAAADRVFHSAATCTFHLPVEVRNYTDFFAGIHHARTAGALMRPEDPLPRNYKHVPIAYHGRASSVCASESVVVRPQGQLPNPDSSNPAFGPSQRLDIELEMGFLVGQGNERGSPISISEAGGHIFGCVLLNDWSARDIQRWEMDPLGPFLSKNFATTISPWIVTADALLPYRCASFGRPEGDPEPLPYLCDGADELLGGFDITLSVAISTERMRSERRPPETIIRSNSSHLYWTAAQMIAHHTVGGCNLVPGDLIGSGTISGPTRAELGSLLELTSAGRDPVTLPTGEARGFLEDGDEITITGRCSRAGFASIGFGSSRGRIAASRGSDLLTARQSK